MGILNIRKPPAQAVGGAAKSRGDRLIITTSGSTAVSGTPSVRDQTRARPLLGRRPGTTRPGGAVVRPPQKQLKSPTTAGGDGFGFATRSMDPHQSDNTMPAAAEPTTASTTATAQEPSRQPARWEHFNDIVAYAPLGNSEQAHIEFIEGHRKPCIAQWVVISKHKNNKGLDPDHPRLLEYLIRLKSFIKYLQTVDMKPRIYTKLGSLKGIINNPDNNFPAFIIKHYNDLEQTWEGTNYGKDDIDDSAGESQDEDANAQRSAPVVRRRSRTGDGDGVDFAAVTVGFPSDDDPVWGLHGAMHGILRTATPRVQYSLDPRFVHEKRSCHVFGHNGLRPGDWWPLQKVALYRGAHGSAMGGIAGRQGEGAYSIVVGSSQYDDLDRDEGNTIWYSGSHSHENRDPVEPADSNATKLLLHSLERSDRPVRVLRKKNDNHWAPAFGLRYDGLYDVVGCRMARNNLGGVYRQFQLRRLPVDPNRPDRNPCTLEETRQKMPAARQAEIWAAVQRGYVPRAEN
ncbi:hypothetical protein MAPG_10326 [Magnaporthiopsis poae ATCC 64411]|uniref:YDG domain-containing protein n=1 Tax=Magnaporthiopsis poae (strain ATCC 64411 / 73-15) TaxID=644358 RepID=A0A0C4ECB1_MAGP6|nr:hypothetical protein MAPG_10326 [Magnaporthiopsis poae ATCC 64411]